MSRRRAVEIIHRPQGWPRQRFVQLSATERRRTGRTSRIENMPGKKRCQHSEYLTNRAGRILKDPDTGYGATIGCKRIARYEVREDKGFAIQVQYYCERHVDHHKEGHR